MVSIKFCVCLVIHLVVLNGHGSIGLVDDSSWDELYTRWRDTFPPESMMLYPCRPQFGDESVSKAQLLGDGGLDPAITFTLPFYGVRYTSVYISVHGHIVPSQSSPAEASRFINQNWPNVLYPNTPDPPFIAPFYGETDFRAEFSGSMDDPSRLFYRILTRRDGAGDAEGKIMTGYLDHVTDHVRDAVVGANDFRATHGLVVTWHQPTFVGGSTCKHDTPQLCIRNTFQAAIVTDQVDTFAVFNYYDISWVGGVSRDCDPSTGRNSDSYPNCQPAYVGFNAGLGGGFTEQPYSNTLKLLEYGKQGAVGSSVVGRFFHKISGDLVVRGGCVSDITLGSPQFPLEVYPPGGIQFGGHEVNVSGPCFSSPNIQCRFGTVVTEGHLFGDNKMKAACPVPNLNMVGDVTLSLSVDGGLNYRFQTIYNVVQVGISVPKMVATTIGHNWKDPDEIRLTWSPYEISWNPAQRVDVKLYGYSESNDGATWSELQTLAENLVNDGYYTLYPGAVQCSGFGAPQKCHSHTVGAVVVARTLSDPQYPVGVWSHPVPLGWYTQEEMHSSYGDEWPYEKCRQWLNLDLSGAGWQALLPACPCTLAQAYADFGRFMPDPYCHALGDLTATINGCARHQGAKHCVYSIRAVGSEPSGSHCCYDDRGRLMYAGDSVSGSLSSRHHAWGRHPYNSQGHVPAMSHMLRDLSGYYYCCAFQEDEYDCYSSYVSRRLTPNCNNYVPGGQAVAFGDPHFVTFDGTLYTFNGWGEFWLARVEDASIGGQQTNFKLQARFEQARQDTWGKFVNATVMTGVAMQGGLAGDPRVEVLLSPRDQEDHHLLVYVDGRLVDFSHPNTIWQEHTDVVLIGQSAASDHVVLNNVTVLYRSGIGIQVASKDHLLHLVMSAPPEFFQHTSGLLGDWNGSPGDDLRPSNGGQSVPAEDLPRVHRQFGVTWATTAPESVFTYRWMLTHDHYNRHLLIQEPSFVQNPGAGGAICGGNSACAYDFLHIGQENVARDSINIQEWNSEVHDMAQPVATCGWLNVLNSIKQEPVDYHVGATAVITGCRSGFRLDGPTSYQCVASGEGAARWSPDVTTQCIDDIAKPGGDLRLALFISIPVAIVLVLILVGLSAFVCYIRQKRRDRAERNDSEKDRDLDDTVSGNFLSSDIPRSGPLPSVGGKPARPTLMDDRVLRGDLSTPTKLPRVNRAMYQEDLSSKGSRRPSTPDSVFDKPSSSLSSVESGNLSLSLAGSTLPKKPPLRQTDTTDGRPRPPYRYPRTTKPGLSPQELSLARLRARERQDPYMYR